MKEENYTQESDDIDILTLVKNLWNHRKEILKITLLCTFIGLFVAVSTKNEYTASTIFMPVSQSGSVGGSLGGLASLAGINLGGASSDSEISPELYPKIVNSIPFNLELLNTKIYVEGVDSLVTYREYYDRIYKPSVLSILKKYTIGLPGLVLKQFKSTTSNHVDKSNSIESVISVSNEEYPLIEQLKQQTNLQINSKEGFVSLDFAFPQAKGSAQMVKGVEELLQKYILNFKTQKSKEELVFLEKRFDEKEMELNELKLKLASFEDQYSSINTSLGRTRLNDLQDEYNLSYNVYSELAKTLETQRFQVKKDTPVFTILEPAVVPSEKSAPKRFLIIVSFIFLGLILGAGFVFGKDFYRKVKEDWS